LERDTLRRGRYLMLRGLDLDLYRPFDYEDTSILLKEVDDVSLIEAEDLTHSLRDRDLVFWAQPGCPHQHGLSAHLNSPGEEREKGL